MGAFDGGSGVHEILFLGRERRRLYPALPKTTKPVGALMEVNRMGNATREGIGQAPDGGRDAGVPIRGTKRHEFSRPSERAGLGQKSRT